MSRYVNLDEKVTAEFYDEEHEERFVKETTVEGVLSICDSYTEVDAEPVIRCKDCRYFERRSIYCHGLCDVHCNGIGDREVKSEVDFCSWAERKKE